MFYKDKIQHLRKDDCRKWWNAVNKMSGRSRKNTSFSLERDGKILSDSELVNRLNSSHTSVNADIPPLDCSVLPAFLPTPDTPPTIEPYQVCTLQPFKACGPDNITPRILK